MHPYISTPQQNWRFFCCKNKKTYLNSVVLMVLIMIERTLIIIKPDGVRRKLVGEVIRRYEQGGLKVVAMKMLKISQELISRHYTKDEGYLISLGKKSE